MVTGHDCGRTAVDILAVAPILNQMVKLQDTPLDRTFAALSDPTRRALVMRLAEQPELSVSELAAPFSMSLPAVMKHLDVLSDAGLVARAKTGRVVACRLDAEPMRDAFEWLNRYEKFWSTRLDRLAAFLEEDESSSRKEELMATATATKPSLTIKRRFKAPPAKVYAAWIDPEKVKGWMGPGEMKAKHAEADVRVGGHYRWVMQAPSGEEHDVGGVYREIVPNEKLVFTWAWKTTPERESIVTVLLKPDGDGTLLTLTHEQFFDDDARDRPSGRLERRARQDGKVCRRVARQK